VIDTPQDPHDVCLHRGPRSRIARRCHCGIEVGPALTVPRTKGSSGPSFEMSRAGFRSEHVRPASLDASALRRIQSAATCVLCEMSPRAIYRYLRTYRALAGGHPPRPLECKEHRS